MINPLNNVPLNTKQVYVVGTTYDGCEIYMPVDSFDENVINRKKNQLQNWLNTQPSPLKPFTGPRIA
jgi:hypothetical protein